MSTLPIPVGTYLAYVPAINRISFMVKIVVGLRYIFIKIGHFATFVIIYSKTVMCTLLIPAGKSLVYIFPIHCIFFMVKIVVGGLLYLLIYKIR